METIEENANGSTFQEIIKAIVPSAEVLEVFSRKTRLLFGKIKANEHENQTPAEIRNLLLPKLMSGEIQLKDTPIVQHTLDGQPIESSQLATLKHKPGKMRILKMTHSDSVKS